MPSITVIRNKLNLRNGSRVLYRVFFAKNKIRDNVRQIFDVLVDSQILEGNDRVICKSGKRVTHDYLLCIMCCARAQVKDSKHCKFCTPKVKKAVERIESIPPAAARIIDAKHKRKLPVIQTNQPHQNAKYYKY